MAFHVVIAFVYVVFFFFFLGSVLIEFFSLAPFFPCCFYFVPFFIRYQKYKSTVRTHIHKTKKLKVNNENEEKKNNNFFSPSFFLAFFFFFFAFSKNQQQDEEKKKQIFANESVAQGWHVHNAMIWTERIKKYPHSLTHSLTEHTPNGWTHRMKLAPVYCCASLSKVKHAQYFLCVL